MQTATFMSKETGGRPKLGVPMDRLPKTWRVTEMSEKHHEIARLLLLGMKKKDIAKHLGASDALVSLVGNSPVVKEQLELLKAERDRDAIDIAQQIKDTLPRAVAILAEQLEDAKISAGLKSRNAFGLLSIGGHGPIKNVNVKGIHAVLTAEDILAIRERGQILAQEIGLVVEGEIEEDSNE